MTICRDVPFLVLVSRCPRRRIFSLAGIKGPCPWGSDRQIGLYCLDNKPINVQFCMTLKMKTVEGGGEGVVGRRKGLNTHPRPALSGPWAPPPILKLQKI